MEKLQSHPSVVSPIDRISDLPDSVLIHILSFLPTRVVVSMSILSRRWKFLWTQVPALEFEDGNYRGNNGEEGERINFVQVVNKVLLHHNAGHLEKFRLQWLEGLEAVYLDKWVSYALARNVRVLNLELDSEFSEYEGTDLPLPGTLFTCGTLEFLRLFGSFMVKVPCVVCLPKLDVLILDSIDYESDECVHNLISGCPVLHSLTIVKIQDGPLKISSSSLRYLDAFYDFYDWAIIDGKLEIDAPALESLILHDHISKEFIVKKPAALKEVKLYLEDDLDDEDESYTDRCNSIVGLIQTLDCVNHLSLNGTTMKALSYATCPLVASFDRLTKLEVKCGCYYWSSLNAVLGCLVKLEVLNIQMHCSCGPDTHKESWREPEVVPIWLLCSLIEVSYGFFAGREGETAMIRYILMHGAIMKRLELLSWADDLENKSQMLEKISMFPRSSSTCQIDQIKFD